MSSLFSFQNMFINNFRVKADDEQDEMIDPHDVLKDDCRDKHCKKYFTKLETCNNRVTSKKQTTETCEEELQDLLGCIDHCVAPKLFGKLK